MTGANRVAPLGYVLRTSGTTSSESQPPAREAHVDMTTDRAVRLAAALYEKTFAGRPRFSRFIASSLWRPFSPPPQDWPLAVCDGTSVADDEGVPNVMVRLAQLPDPDNIPEHCEGEDVPLPAASIFHFSPRHRWWYFPDMTRDEVLLVKFHDSDHSKAWRAPHTSFRDPGVQKCAAAGRASNFGPLPTIYDSINTVRALGRRLGQLHRRDVATAALPCQRSFPRSSRSRSAQDRHSGCTQARAKPLLCPRKALNSWHMPAQSRTSRTWKRLPGSIRKEIERPLLGRDRGGPCRHLQSRRAEIRRRLEGCRKIFHLVARPFHSVYVDISDATAEQFAQRSLHPRTPDPPCGALPITTCGVPSPRLRRTFP